MTVKNKENRTPRRDSSRQKANDPKADQVESPLQSARVRLHPSAVQSSLPGRDREFSEIRGFLVDALHSKTGSCLYISGLPGTGKTATVRAVMEELIAERDAKETNDFGYLAVNGMELTDPAHLYVLLCEQLTGEKYTSKAAASYLERFFSSTQKSSMRKPLILLVDELDQFIQKKQKVIYNLFDWPNRKQTQLIVIAIANTMDLPERVMLNRVASRIGLTRLNFEPYTYTQLEDIVKARLQGLNVFEKDAIEMCARKVSAVSGDARRVLDICAHAISIVEKTGSADAKVTLSAITRAIKDMFSSATSQALEAASLHQKVLLAAIVKYQRFAGVPVIELASVLAEHRLLCSLRQIHCPQVSEINFVLSQLLHSAWISADSGSLSLHSKIQLDLTEDDIVSLFKRTQDQRLKGILG